MKPVACDRKPPHQVAVELTEHDALTAHAELNIDPEDLVSPVQAAAASALSFLLGALLPMAAIMVPPPAWRVPVTFVSALVALGIAGAVSAWIGVATFVWPSRGWSSAAAATDGRGGIGLQRRSSHPRRGTGAAGGKSRARTAFCLDQ